MNEAKTQPTRGRAARRRLANQAVVPKAPAPALVASLVIDREEAQSAALMIKSLRTFGGPFAGCPIWVAHPATFDPSSTLLSVMDVRLVPLRLDAPFHHYPYAYKPYAAASLASMAADLPGGVDTLLWLDYAAVVLNPLSMFVLAPDVDAALRPVFVRNVGSLAEDPLDAYWSGIYSAVGLEEASPHTVQSTDDGQVIKQYFNCAGYALRLSTGLPRLWWEHFQALVRDAAFQASTCPDANHRVFLHQTVFSAVIQKHVPWERIRHLPAWYGSKAFEDPAYFFSYDGLPDPDGLRCLESRPDARAWLQKQVQLIEEELIA